ncbi:hypothetical protein Avbf_07836 [Armadillidium vulgare]|nr:hypothetical protein Avbf_07836 [Armadillidium vulgare]
MTTESDVPYLNPKDESLSQEDIKEEQIEEFESQQEKCLKKDEHNSKTSPIHFTFVFILKRYLFPFTLFPFTISKPPIYIIFFFPMSFSIYEIGDENNFRYHRKTQARQFLVKVMLIWKELGTLRDQFPFSGDSGVKISDEIEARDVVEIFESIVTDNIIQHICNETNKYSNVTISTHKSAFTVKKKAQ